MKPQRDDADTPAEDLSFQKKVWITAAIFGFMVIVLLLIKYTFNVILLVLAGSLIAIFFKAIGSIIQRKTGWQEGICTAISILSTILFLAALLFFIGATVQAQFVELVETIPKTVDKAKAWLGETSVGQIVIEKVFSENSMEKAQVFLSKFFQSTFGVLGDLYVVLFIGIFFTISPQIYIKGLVDIVPVKGQKKAQHVLDTIGEQLRKWLKGILLSMVVVFVLTAFGLAIIGIPLWLVLALLAGLLCFIPNFGPLIALIPAVLVALLQGPQTALLVGGLYILIQFIESNFISPLIQKKLINMPPALILIAQLFMGALTGAWGLVLALPVMIIIIVLVQELYIKNRTKQSKKSTAA